MAAARTSHVPRRGARLQFLLLRNVCSDIKAQCHFSSSLFIGRDTGNIS